LFTDVEGSTRLWQVDREAMASALALHDAIVRGAVESHRGYVFSTAGDSFGAAFWTPDEALAAVAAAQAALAGAAWPDTVVIRVRMGIHTGTASERGGDYFGSAVNKAARVMAAGHGGQVLLSLATEELVRDKLRDGQNVVDLGIHMLSGFDRPERLFQLSEGGLGRDFPPLRTAGMVGNLAEGLTSFVGRAEELGRLVELSVGCRLVCVTGAGGMGKTRLALAAGAALTHAFPDGVWLVELAPVGQADAVDAAAMAALREAPIPGDTPREVVINALRSRHALVILDNCEHVSDAVGDLVVSVLRSCTRVHVLATSRQALDVDGERSFALGALATTDQVRLFCDRAAAVRPDTALDTDRVRIICARLDGMPLAIELAAARMRSMSLTELEERLGERFRLLDRRRGGDPRHRTLRAVVDWSFEQLSPAEQAFLCRLSVFAGDFSLDAARAVGGEPNADDLVILDQLDDLVGKSLIIATDHGSHRSYSLLETLRQYGREHLEPEELLDVAHRHAEYFISVVARLMRALRDGDDETALLGMASSWDNVRAAVHHAIAAQDLDLALRLTTPLTAYVNLRPEPELATWTQAALALPNSNSHPLALWAHLLLSQVAYPALALDAAEEHARWALAIQTQLGLWPVPRPYFSLGFALVCQGRFDEAERSARRGVEIAREQGRTMELIEGLMIYISCALYRGSWADDRDIDELARLATSEQDNPRALAIAYSALGPAALARGRPEAQELLAQAAELAVGSLPTIEGFLAVLAHVAVAPDAPDRQLVGLAEALNHYENSRLPFALRCCLRMCTPALSQLNRYRTVAIFDGAGLPTSLLPRQADLAVSAARQALGDAEYEAGVARGRELRTDEVADFVRAELETLAIHTLT
jgi:predicted ATPase/class 3 adenylate cyclase